VRRLARGLAISLAYGAVLFALAARLDVPLLWVFWSIGAIGRFHWSDTVPRGLEVAALLAYAAGIGFVVWSMAVLGMVFGYGASGLALGSWWAFLPSAACAVLVLRRAALEDRYLQQHLAGYREYSQRVPYRLFPGLW